MKLAQIWLGLAGWLLLGLSLFSAENSLPTSKAFENARYSCGIQEVVTGIVSNDKKIQVSLIPLFTTPLTYFMDVRPAHESASLDVFRINGTFASFCELFLYHAILETGTPGKEIVIDVGGNAGIMTNFFAKHPSVSRVFTFEASPKTFQRLSTSVCLNNNQNNVDIFNFGVSDKSDTIYLLDSEVHSGMTSLMIHGSQSRHDGVGWSQVQTRSLDTVLFDEDRKLTRTPLLMKIDCEGCEANALLGASKILKAMPPKYIYFEVIFEFLKSELKKMFDLLWSSGYRCFNAGPPDCASANAEMLQRSLRFMEYEIHESENSLPDTFAFTVLCIHSSSNQNLLNYVPSNSLFEA